MTRGSRSRTERHRRPLVEEWEPRVLYSADVSAAVGTLLPGLAEAQSLDLGRYVEQPGGAMAAADAALSAAATSGPRHEIVFIDVATPDWQGLLDGIRAQGAEGREIDAVLIDPARDGVGQISAALADATAGGNRLSAIHIISHGAPGELRVGAGTLDAASLDRFRVQIAAWGNALDADGDILLYGCDVARGEQGRVFVSALAAMTGADVAASADPTGNAARGGDWALEYRSGAIEATLAVSGGEQARWNGLLATTAQGGETLVNTTTAGGQQTPYASRNVAMDASGNYVVVWQDGSGAGGDTGIGIYAQRYNAAGVAQGGAIHVNTYTSDNQSLPEVAMDSSGNFVVVWQSMGQDGGNMGVYAQRYNAGGVAQGAEFRVNTTTNLNQQTPAVAMNAGGSFVVAWSGYNTGNNTYEIYAQRYNASGVAQGGEFLVNSTIASDQQEPALAIDSAGNFVVVWQSNLQDGSDWGVYGQRYNASGVAQGGEFRVNTTVSNIQNLPSVAMDGNGFVVAWQSNLQDGSGWGIYAQRYNASGVAQGGEFRISTTTAGTQENPMLAMTRLGGFLASWDSDGQDGSLAGVYLREYDGSGAALTGETRVNTTTSGSQWLASVAADANGRAVVVWSGNGTGDADGVFAQRYTYAVNDAPVNTVPGAQTTNEDAGRVFSAANGNQIAISEADAGSNPLEVTLAVTNGTLSLSGTTNLVFSAGDGGADATMSFRGTVADINNALNGLSYNPTANYSGAATLTLGTLDSTLVSLNVDASLKGRYSFDNGGDPGNDSSPAGANDGTVVGATPVVDATRGNVLSFDGNDYVQVAGHFGNPANVTLAAWVNLTAADSGGAEVVSLGDSLILRLDSNDGGLAGLRGSYYDGTDWIDFNHNVNLAGTGWHHVAYSFDDTNNTRTLYLDGVAVASEAVTASIAYTVGANSTVGTYGNGSTIYDFTGRIDEARIYSRVLTAAEVANLANDLALRDSDTVAITVNAVNDAPSGVTASLFSAIAEDDFNSAGKLVSDFTASTTDPDAGALKGIAIHEANNANGQWQYTLDGSNWTNVGAVSTASALLLPADAVTRVRFVPNPDYNGVVFPFSYRAWDQTTGVAGGHADTSVTGGSTAFSTQASSVSISVTAVNDAPVITSNGGGATAGVAVVENTTAVATVSAADVDGGAPTYSISGGADAAKFAINASTGALSFVAAPDYESPTDAGGNNVYDVTVQVSDGAGGTDTQALSVTVTAVNDNAPVITSDGGGATASLSVAENTTAVTLVTATDADLPAQTLTYGITGGADAARFAIDAATGALGFVAAPNFDAPTDANGDNVYEVTVQVSDGAGGTATQALGVTVTNDTLPGLWLSTKSGATAGGTSWTDGAVMRFADPNLSLGSGTTDGSFSKIFDIDSFAADGNADINGLHYVRRTVTVGTINAVTLNPGDVLFSVAANETFGGVSVTDKDVVLFRPAAANDYSSGSFSVLLRDPGATGNKVRDFAVVETAMTVGGAALQAGDFLLVLSSASYDKDVSLFRATNLGTAPTSGTLSEFIDGQSAGISLNPQIYGLDLVDRSITLGGQTLTAGQLLVSVNGNDTVGANNLATTAYDVFVLDVAATGTGTSSGTATRLMTGADVGLSAGGEEYDALSLWYTSSQAPVITSNGGGATAAVSVAENTTAVSMVTASDADLPSQTLTYSIVGGADAARFAINPATGALSFAVAPNFDAPADAGANNVYDVVVQVSDGGLTDTQALAVTVTNLNEAPSGADNTVTTAEDTPYTFSAADFGFGDPADVPANTLAAVKITTLPGAGSLTLNGTAVIAGQFVAVADLNAGRLAFTPAANANGAGYASFSFQVQDNGGSAGGGVDLDATPNILTVDVSALNDAPVLDSSGTMTLTPISEDAVGNVGDAVFSIIASAGGNRITDADSGAFEGIAVTGSASGNGTWQYSIDGGFTWNGLGAVSDTSALLLRETDRLRFVPDGCNADAASISFRAWDETAGAPGSKVDASVNGGASAFSTAIETATITVTAVNDEQVLATKVGATVVENSTGNVIGPALLATTDVDNTPAQLLYTLTAAPAHGVLRLNGVALGMGGGFTQADIDAGRLSYDHDGSETDSDGFAFTVDDGAGSASAGSFALTITPVNDNAPVITSDGGGATASLSVAENTTAVTPVTATDADLPAQTLSYTIVGGADAARFTIDAASGALSFVVAPDREVPTDADGDNVYEVIVQASDGALTDTQTLNITVADVDEFDVGPVADADPAADSVAESAAVGTTVGLTAAASDADATTSTVTYALTDDAGGRFAIDAASGAVTVAGVLDYESATSHGIVVRATSADGSFSTRSFTIAVANANDNAPQLASGSTLDYVENQPATPINTALTVTDADSATLASATVALTAGHVAGEDVLAFTNTGGMGNIAAGWDAASGVLTLSSAGATATLAEWQAALRAVSYENLSDAPSTAPRTVAWAVSDGLLASSVVTSTVQVAAVNDAPTGSDRTVTTAEDTAHAFTAADFGFGDPQDASAHALAAVRIATLPGAGSLTLNGVAVAAGQFVARADIDAGRLAFTPAADASGAAYASFTFQVQDDGGTANGGSDLDPVANTLTVEVTPVNDAPFITSDGGGASAALAVAENATAATTVTSGDIDGGAPVYSVVGGADAARFAIDTASGALRFVAAPDFEAPLDADGDNVYQVVVQVSDGALTDTQALTVSVTDENDNAPVITPGQSFGVAENAAAGTVVGSVAASDADTGTVPGPWSIVGGNTGGAFAIDAASGVIRVADPAALDFETNPFFDLAVTVSDGANSSAVQTVRIDLADLNEAPAGADRTLATAEDTPLVLGVGDFGFTDPDAGDSLAAVRVDSLTGAGQLTLDGVAVAAGQVIAAADIAAGRLVFAPAPDAYGAGYAAIGFSVRDAGGLHDPAPNTLAIDVTAVNDEQLLAANTGITVAENAAGTVITAAMLVATDVDDAPGQLVYTVTAAPAAGTLRLNGVALGGGDSFTQAAIAAGLLTYDHDGAEGAADGFGFSLDDGAGAATAGVFAITITPVNDQAPVITSDGGAATATLAVAENATAVTTVAATDADLPAQTLAYSIVGGADAARFTIDAASGALSFVVAADFEAPADAGADNSYEVMVQASDGSLTDIQTLVVTVGNVNEGAVGAVADTDAGPDAVAENSATGAVVGITARASDPDTPDTITYSLADDAGGRFAIDAASGEVSVADGSLLDREAAASHDIVVRALSSDGSVSVQGFTIVLSDMDEFDVGVAVDTDAAADAVAENSAVGTPVGIAAFAADGDATNNAVSYALDDDAGGRFAIDAATGVISVAGPLDYETTASHVVVVRAHSADGSSASHAFTIAVLPVNEAPWLETNTGAGMNEGDVLTLTGSQLRAGDVDDAAADLTYTVLAAPMHGSLQLGGVILGAGSRFTQADIDAGLVTYTHDGGETGADGFDFEVNDAQGLGVAPARFAIAVAPVNDAPQAGELWFAAAEDTAVTGSLLAAARDAEALRAEVLAGPAHGRLDLAADGSFSYMPDADWNGEDSFSYRVSDGAADSAAAAVRVTVSAVNDVPQIRINRLSIGVGETVTLTTGDVAVSDADSAAGQIVLSVEQLAHGRFELAGAPGVAVSSFTVEQLQRGMVRFAQDGGLDAPAYTLAVRDQADPGLPDVASVAFSTGSGGDAGGPAPVVTAPESPVPPPREKVAPPSQPEPDAPPSPAIPEPAAGGAADVPAPAPAAVESGGAKAAGGDHAGHTAQVWRAETRADAAAKSAYVAIDLGEAPSALDSLATPAGRIPLVSAGTKLEAGPLAPTQWRDLPATGDGVQILLNLARPAGITLTVGAVVWATRAGGLIASLLATAPAWRGLDPLPVLQRPPEDDGVAGHPLDPDAEGERDERAAQAVLA